MAIAAQLRRGIAELGIKLPTEAETRLCVYLTLIAKWNRIYNLTAVRAESLMVVQHLLDSLAVIPHLGDVAMLADIGSGAGLPGIPLAIARPEMTVALIESNQKKASFLQQAKIELKLDNVSIHCVRAEDFRPDDLFNAAVSRAFSELAGFVRVAGHLLAPDGRLLAMKGVHPQAEIAQLPVGWQVMQSIALAVPELDAQRHLIVIKKT
ncbi:MAG TPA: 16S rRNA (guanine(527)-N(7))-methyltransferase RsmG [Rhodocyclaceae bacterium]|nr:16S rRNA (guanine(527)-N(7))-methyltransferase RsmG [Rhodocyclaceae bacterium]